MRASFTRPRPRQDNLLPITCRGVDWQGGMAITLVDSLDALMVCARARVERRNTQLSGVCVCVVMVVCVCVQLQVGGRVGSGEEWGGIGGVGRGGGWWW